MAEQKDINKWYENFITEMESRGIDITKKEDALRIRIPNRDMMSSQPLFPYGFEDTPENREALYDKAKKGEAFFFDKRTKEAYQLGSNSKKDCLANRANPVGVMPEAPGPLYNLLNLLTLGVFEAFMGKQKEYDKELKHYYNANHIPDVGNITKFLNYVTFGLFRHDKCMDHERALERIEICSKMEDILKREEGTWELKEEKKQEKAQKKEEKEAKKEAKKEAENVKDSALDNPEAKSHMMKSQLKQEYEAMREAFGPGGKGWTEAIEHANSIGKIAAQIKNDPAMKKAIGFNDKKCEKFENLSKSMNAVYQRGMEAKETMLDQAKYQALKPEQKEKCIQDLQAMNVLQNTFANSELAKDQPWREGKTQKASRLIQQMRKEPDKFQETMKNVVNKLGSTNKLREMSAEQISAYVSNEAAMMNGVKEDMRQANTANQDVIDNQQQVRRNTLQPQRKYNLDVEQPQIFK